MGLGLGCHVKYTCRVSAWALCSQLSHLPQHGPAGESVYMILSFYFNTTYMRMLYCLLLRMCVCRIRFRVREGSWARDREHASESALARDLRERESERAREQESKRATSMHFLPFFRPPPPCLPLFSSLSRPLDLSHFLSSSIPTFALPSLSQGRFPMDASACALAISLS